MSPVYRKASPLYSGSTNDEDSIENTNDEDIDQVTFETEEDKREAVGNLVADDEWDGLTMELADLVRKSCTCMA